jgi:hypothetical protein
MRWDPGLETVRDRILTLREFERTKQRLLGTLVESLDPTEALRQLNHMSTQLMKPKLTAQYESLLAQLIPDGDSDDTATPAVAAPAMEAAKLVATPAVAEAPDTDDGAVAADDSAPLDVPADVQPPVMAAPRKKPGADERQVPLPWRELRPS